MGSERNKTLTFRTVDGRKFTGQVRNPAATLGSVAGNLAARAGLAGTFEMIASSGVTLDPDVTLGELPDLSEITLSSSLTPTA